MPARLVPPVEDFPTSPPCHCLLLLLLLLRNWQRKVSGADGGFYCLRFEAVRCCNVYMHIPVWWCGLQALQIFNGHGRWPWKARAYENCSVIVSRSPCTGAAAACASSRHPMYIKGHLPKLCGCSCHCYLHTAVTTMIFVTVAAMTMSLLIIGGAANDTGSMVKVYASAYSSSSSHSSSDSSWKPSCIGDDLDYDDGYGSCQKIITDRTTCTNPNDPQSTTAEFRAEGRKWCGEWCGTCTRRPEPGGICVNWYDLRHGEGSCANLTTTTAAGPSCSAAVGLPGQNGQMMPSQGFLRKYCAAHCKFCTQTCFNIAEFPTSIKGAEAFEPGICATAVNAHFPGSLQNLQSGKETCSQVRARAYATVSQVTLNWFNTFCSKLCGDCSHTNRLSASSSSSFWSIAVIIVMGVASALVIAAVGFLLWWRCRQAGSNQDKSWNANPGLSKAPNAELEGLLTL